jgi:hypothetical protein
MSFRRPRVSERRPAPVQKAIHLPVARDRNAGNAWVAVGAPEAVAAEGVEPRRYLEGAELESLLPARPAPDSAWRGLPLAAEWECKQSAGRYAFSGKLQTV